MRRAGKTRSADRREKGVPAPTKGETEEIENGGLAVGIRKEEPEEQKPSAEREIEMEDVRILHPIT